MSMLRWSNGSYTMSDTTKPKPPTEANPPPKAVTFTSTQQYCNRCQSKVNLCDCCNILFYEHSTIYCIEGRHIHTFCLTKYLKEVTL